MAKKNNNTVTVKGKLMFKHGQFEFILLGHELVVVNKYQNKTIKSDFLNITRHPLIEMIFFDGNSKKKDNYGISVHSNITEKELDRFIANYMKRKKQHAEGKMGPLGSYFMHLSPDISFLVDGSKGKKTQYKRKIK